MWTSPNDLRNHQRVGFPDQSTCDCPIRFSPWQSIRLYRLAGTQLKQEGDLPDFIAYMADGTAGYEAEIRQAWEAFKLSPTKKHAKEFIDFLKSISAAMWPEVMASILGIGVEELTAEQHKVLADALAEHHGYMEESLLPDVTRAAQLGRLDQMDYRTVVLYAGALWQFGNLATVMFDGLNLRDLADLFMFAGPNDSETCTGERGCQSHANRVYTVAQILTEEIIPGRMRCLTNCRHFLLPLASPLKGVKKHQAGRHDQKAHSPYKNLPASVGQLNTYLKGHDIVQPSGSWDSPGYVLNPSNVEELTQNYLPSKGSESGRSIVSGFYDTKTGALVFALEETNHPSLAGSVVGEYSKTTVDMVQGLEDRSVHIVAELRGDSITKVDFGVGRAAVPWRAGDLPLDEEKAFDNVYRAMDKLNNWGLPADTKVTIQAHHMGNVNTTLKHQMGRHDQRTHTPEAYRGQGVVPEKPGPKPYVPERVRELMDPESETNQQAAKDWKNLSHADRMKLADPDAMDRGMAENLRRYREEVEIPHDLKGQKLTTKTYDQVAANTQARIDSLQGALTPVTEAQLREYADTHMRKAVEQGLKDKSLKMDAGQLDDMMAKNVDKLVHQEIEARKRQLGDHGIRHVVGNVRAVDAMLDDPDLPATTGLQRMMALQTMVDHDMGYTVGVVAASIPATEYHPQYSEKYAKAQGYEKLFGAGNAKEMTRMVREHAGTDLDWEKDTLMSAVRTADNTALFNREKLPALFYDVPGATDELYRLQLAQVGGTGKEATPKVQENLRKLVTDSAIDDRHKAELMLAVDEVSPYTGKFSLGMASGEIEGYDYKKDGLMHIKVKGKPERELLTGLFDLGDRQFDKFAEAYDTTGNPSVGGLDFSKGGKKVLHIDYEEPTRKATGTLATMYDDSVRPDIRLASRQAGPASTLTDRERAWPMIQANVKGKLTAGEMAEFESRFKAGTLDEMPLTERERSYLETKLKEMLKHLAGQHDQSTHTPKKYGRGKRINSERSRELARQCDPQKKECYKNAFTSLALAGEGAKYVEGYAVDNEIGFPFEHGWIETEDELLDPTLIMLDDDLAARYTYFPANEWTHSEMFDEFDVGGATLPLSDMRDPKQQAAFKAAMAHLGYKTKQASVYKSMPGYTTMSQFQWDYYKSGAVERLAQLMHVSVAKVWKHLPGQHSQLLHTPHKHRSHAGMAMIGYEAEAAARAEALRPIHQAVHSAVLHKYPDLLEDPEMLEFYTQDYMEMMALDEERFMRYSDKLGLGLTKEDAGKFFEGMEKASKARAQAQWKYRHQATAKSPETGQTHVMSHIGGELSRASESYRTDSLMEAERQLAVRGVTVQRNVDIPDAELHQELNRLLGLADAQPAVGRVTDQKLRRVIYEAKREGDPRARAGHDWIRVYHEPGQEAFFGMNSGDWAHEMGHVADVYDPKYLDHYGKGRHVSTYAWTDPSEDFAETWTASLGRGPESQWYRDQVPGKMSRMDALIDELSIPEGEE